MVCDDRLAQAGDEEEAEDAKGVLGVVVEGVKTRNPHDSAHRRQRSASGDNPAQSRPLGADARGVPMSDPKRVRLFSARDCYATVIGGPRPYVWISDKVNDWYRVTLSESDLRRLLAALNRSKRR